MQKHHGFFAVLAIMVCFAAVLSAQPAQEEGAKGNVLTVYSSSSFCGEWGAGPSLAKAFQEKTGYTVNLVDCGSTGEMVTKLISEKDNPKRMSSSAFRPPWPRRFIRLTCLPRTKARC
jgi:ABC-type thiamine transport system substrate-binding protein